MEKVLSPELIALLDRLYDYKSESSSIIAELVSKFEEISQRKISAENTIEGNKELIKGLSEDQQAVRDEYDSFKKKFDDISADDFKKLFEATVVEFDIDALKNRIYENHSDYAQRVGNEIVGLKEKNEDLSSEITDRLDPELAELELKKSEAENNKSELNRMLSEIFAGSESISKHDLKELLKKFGFNDLECEELSKAMLFPEDGLFVYDAQVKAQEAGKTVSQIVREATSAPEEIAIQKAVYAAGDTARGILNAKYDLSALDDGEIIAKLLLGEKLDENDRKRLAELAVNEKNAAILKQNITVLKDLLVNDEKANAYTIEKLISLIAASKELLFAEDLKDRIAFVIDLGKDVTDITNCIQILMISVDKLKEAQKKLGVETVPLMVFCEGAEKFVANVNNIKNRGYELEDSQITKMPIALTEDPEQLDNTLNVADANGLSLYSLYSFAADVCTMSPSALEPRLNLYAANDELDVILHHPDKIFCDAARVIARVKYCKANDKPYRSESETGAYLSYIFNEDEFNRVVGPVDLTEYIANVKDEAPNFVPGGKA